jgi:hypothetical protein
LPTDKCYSWDGSTYTDISGEVKGDVPVPVLALNADQTAIFQGIQIRTKLDYTESYLAVGKYFVIERDTKKIWYGLVSSNYYDYGSRMYVYNISSYFEKLKSKTMTTLLTYIWLYSVPPETVVNNTALPEGESILRFREPSIKGILRLLIEGSDFLNMTSDFQIGTNLTTLLDYMRIPSKVLEFWGSDLKNYNLVATDKNMLDLLVVILRQFGLRMYFSDTETITINGSDTAPTVETFDNDYVFDYSKSEKSSEKLKKLFLKQKEMLIRDDRNPDYPEYYYSIGVAFSYSRVKDMIDSGVDLELTFFQDHKLPANNPMFYKLKMTGYNDGTVDQEKEEWSQSDTDKIKLINTQLVDMRYSRTNVVSHDVEILTKTAGSKIVTLGIADMVNTNDLRVELSGLYFGTKDVCKYINGTYTYEVGTGTPSAAGKYRKNSDSEIVLYCDYSISGILEIWQRLLYATPVTEPDISGTVYELSGAEGTPKYIQHTERTTILGTGVIAIHYGANHDVAITDTLSLFGTNIDGDYTRTGSVPASGEFYIFDTDIIYILDEGQELDLPCDVRVYFEDYENKKQLTTEGREEEYVNLYDYLTIYRPGYSTAGDWKDDWQTVSLQDTVYTLLLNATLYAPWWFYHFSPYYQTVYHESLSIEDTETADFTKAKKITYNIGDKSISIDQESV